MLRLTESGIGKRLKIARAAQSLREHRMLDAAKRSVPVIRFNSYDRIDGRVSLNFSAINLHAVMVGRDATPHEPFGRRTSRRPRIALLPSQNREKPLLSAQRPTRNQLYYVDERIYENSICRRAR